MPLSGNGRSVVVTGAGGGIGSSIALHLARSGFRVVAADILPEYLVRLEALAIPEKLAIDTVLTDTSSEEEVSQLFARANALPEDLYGAVLCAGVTKRVSVLDTKREDFDEILNVNVMGTFFGVRQAGMTLRDQRLGGAIVVITSINALRALPTQAAYSASKAAMESLVTSAAVEFGPFGVRVNAIAPGAILTDMNPELNARSPLSKKVPLGRLGKPEDLNGAVEFLLSDSSRYVTGSSLVVDGGLMHAR